VATAPGQPVTEQETRDALTAVDAAVADGRITPDDGATRKDHIRHAVTPRDLWKASGGLAGDSESGNPIGKGVLVALGFFLAVAVVLAAVLHFTFHVY
jgi:hypothetical protein